MLFFPADDWGVFNRLKNRAFCCCIMFNFKGAITSKIKLAINIKQVLQDLHSCCTTVAALISILF